MSPTLEELIKQREELDRQITEVRGRETRQAIEDCRTKIKLYGLTAADLGLAKVRKPRGPNKVKRNP